MQNPGDPHPGPPGILDAAEVQGSVRVILLGKPAMDRRFQGDQRPDPFSGFQLVALLEVAGEHATETNLMGLIWPLVYVRGKQHAGPWA